MYLNRLNSFVDWFIGGEARSGSNEHRRLRMFLISHLLGPSWATRSRFSSTSMTPTPGRMFTFSARRSRCSGVSVARQVLPKHYTALALLSVQNLIFAILWGSYHYGGASSPFLMWLLVVPLLAFFYLGSNTTTRIVVFIQIAAGLARSTSPTSGTSRFPCTSRSRNGRASASSRPSAPPSTFLMASYYAQSSIPSPSC